MSEYVFEVENISKKFPGVLALDNVSLNVRKGEVLGLIGENGAGKSTLLKIMNGIYPYGSYEGKILYDGKQIKYKSAYEAIQNGIGFVPQETNVMDDLSVAENIYAGHLTPDKTKKGFNRKSMVNRCRIFLEDNKINLNATSKAITLSIGQKQLLMVAKALSWDPGVLILDEPTTALSGHDVENLFSIVKNLKEMGKSIIFVTHKLDEIFNLTDRVTILRDGKVINTFQKNKYERKAIISAMVGRELSQLYPSRDVEIGEIVLSVEKLTVPHPVIEKRNLVENISFDLKRGELLGIAGLVGSGRSETVTALMGGYGSHYSGNIRINGKDVKIRSEADAIKHGINMLTEDRKSSGLLLLHDIKDNIVLSDIKKVLNQMRIISKKKAEACSNVFMKSLRIKANSTASMVANLSGGNQQKVVLARALHSNPKILILDEPTKGIDVGSKQEIYEIMNDLLIGGMSIIMISSELPELLGICDRFIIMSMGKKVGEIDKNEATQESIMELCFE